MATQHCVAQQQLVSNNQLFCSISWFCLHKEGYFAAGYLFFCLFLECWYLLGSHQTRWFKAVFLASLSQRDFNFFCSATVKDLIVVPDSQLLIQIGLFFPTQRFYVENWFFFFQLPIRNLNPHLSALVSCRCSSILLILSFLCFCCGCFFFFLN